MAFKSLRNLFGSQRPNVKATEAYQEWRKLIFAVPPEQAGLSRSDANRVYGVIMDVGQMDARSAAHWALSLSAFSTGEASFRPTVGGGAIGLGEDPKVAQAAQEIVQIAQGLLPKTSPTQDTSLPEPGVIQFFFLTTNGVHMVKGSLDQFQKPESPFLQFVSRFAFIQQFADQIADQAANQKPPAKPKALYVLTFTPEQMDRFALMRMTHLAGEKLKAQNPIFKKRIEEEMSSKTRTEIGNLQYDPNVHTPTSMQTSMNEWLKKQYNVSFHPTSESNFFVHGMKDPQGKENFLLFYFDMEG
jgi:hypothetical protein